MMKTTTTMTKLNRSLLSIAASLVLSASLNADCTYELFTITSAKGTTISHYVDQLSESCEYSVIIADEAADKIMLKKLNKVNFKNLTIQEVFDIILAENNLAYSLENNILKISYLQTKTYNIDYIITSRRSIGRTDITVSSQSPATMGRGSQAPKVTKSQGDFGDIAVSGQSSDTGIKIESMDEVIFWEELDLELQRVLNRPEDSYLAEAPIINKNAGFITLTATMKQHTRLDTYLHHLQKKMQYQVLIDVRMLAVRLSKEHSTGVDWAQIYALQNFGVSLDKLNYKNVSEFESTSGTITEALYGDLSSTASLVKLTGTASIDEVIKFLDTQGDVKTVSNPKVLTLNNQPALITVGTEYFYKIQQSAILAGSSSGTSTTTQNDQVQSVFAGVLLDITPEISNDDTITLKINPSISATRVDISSDTDEQKGRTMPPDLDRRQMAAVVTVKDGNRIVIGGLIDERTTFEANQVPLLGDIPLFGYAFKYEEKVVNTTEIVIIIEPHIVKKENNNLTLSDLGYTKTMQDEIRSLKTMPADIREANKEANE